MKPIHALLLVVLSALPLACKSSGTKDANIPCTCGQAEADLDGCAHAACLAGKNNPDNPDCVCGSLSIGKKN